MPPSVHRGKVYLAQFADRRGEAARATGGLVECVRPRYYEYQTSRQLEQFHALHEGRRRGNPL